jgi:Cu-processing system ATP-binding protein
MVIPTSGHILFDGKDIANDCLYRSQIGYMPQIGRYPDNMKVGQLFDMLRDLRNVSNLDEELIEGFKLKDFYAKTMRSLSGGMRQKVSAALAFLFESSVMILDEPTAGLDPLSVEILKEKIIRERDKNRLFLITSHIVSDLDDITTDVMYLVEGKLIFYKPIDVLKTEMDETQLGKAIAKVMRGDLSKKKLNGKVSNTPSVFV